MTAVERQRPDPIHDALMARLDDWIETALNPQEVARALRAALDVCRNSERNALRWECQLLVPDWVTQVREAAAAEMGITRGQT